MYHTEAGVCFNLYMLSECSLPHCEEFLYVENVPQTQMIESDTKWGRAMDWLGKNELKNCDGSLLNTSEHHKPDSIHILYNKCLVTKQNKSEMYLHACRIVGKKEVH